MHHVRSSLTLVFLAFSLPVLAADGTVTGSLTANGKTVALTHAYAQASHSAFDKKKKVLVVIVTDQEISPAAVADDFALMEAQEKQHLSGFTATIDDDKDIISGTVFSPEFKKMKQFSSVGPQKLTLKALTAARIAGTVAMAKPDDFFDEHYQYNATFDLPIAKAAVPPPPPVLKGTKLPAGGGEPGKAYMAYLKVVAGGDMKAFLNSVVAERAKEASADPDFKKLFPILKGMQPTGVKVVSGAVEGDNATLLATGKDGDQVQDGTITMVKEGGSWKVGKEDWKTR